MIINVVGFSSLTLSTAGYSVMFVNFSCVYIYLKDISTFYVYLIR